MIVTHALPTIALQARVFTLPFRDVKTLATRSTATTMIFARMTAAIHWLAANTIYMIAMI